MRMGNVKLFMVLVGCRPAGRLTEQHDVFFGIAATLKELLPAINQSWPEAKGQLHIDAWRTVSSVAGHAIEVIKKPLVQDEHGLKLFFINLGGYKENEFEEYHYKMLNVATNKMSAMKIAKQSAFYKHTGFEGAAAAHIDEQYGIDVDDLYQIEDILPLEYKELYSIRIKKQSLLTEDTLHIGYLKWTKVE
jgi:hypothetical protein